jgi:hypothetical protein
MQIAIEVVGGLFGAFAAVASAFPLVIGAAFLAVFLLWILGPVERRK